MEEEPPWSVQPLATIDKKPTAALTRPSALGMSDPEVKPLEILETPEFISFLKFFQGMNGTLTTLSKVSTMSEV